MFVCLLAVAGTTNLYACSAVYRMTLDTSLAIFDGTYSLEVSIGTLDGVWTDS